MKIPALIILSTFVVISKVTALKLNSTLEEKIIFGLSPETGRLFMKVPEFSILASIRDKNDVHTCTGVAIGPHKILSAADCLIPYENIPQYDGIFVRLQNIRADVEILDVPDADTRRDPECIFADLGLLTVDHVLSSKLCMTFPRKIEETAHGGGCGFLLGWNGHRSDEHNNNEFSILNLGILDRGINCLQDRDNSDTFKIFCAVKSPVNNRFADVNDGDRGCPLFKNNKLIGILSKRHKEIRPDVLVFTDITMNNNYLIEADHRSTEYIKNNLDPDFDVDELQLVDLTLK